MNKILIIEDDTLISDLQKDYLETSDYIVEIENNGKIGLEKALQNEYNLIILDIMLPDLNGFEICREIRKTIPIPIIIVSAKKEDIDKIKGLSLGATDYIIKPFSPAELVARVKAHIKNYELLTQQKIVREKTEIVVKNLSIFPDSHRVYLDEKEIILANKEFELLLFLATNANIVFTKEVLFNRIWGQDTFGDIATVTVHINRLREKLKTNTTKIDFIQTVWGAGYRFVV